MLMQQTSVVVILAFCILVEASGLGIHIFGKKDASVKDDASGDEGIQKQDSTRPPLLTIPRPEDHPLHHNNDPNHPFNNLPSLGGTRSTIVATKTVYVEVTSTITEHPVCIEVQGVKPPCLPHYNYGQGYGVHSEQSGVPTNSFGFQAGVNGFFREGGEEIDRIQPTATMEMLEPTRILGGVSETAPAPSEYQDDEEIAEEGEARSARYLKIHGATPSAPLKAESEIVEAPENADEGTNGRTIENLMNRQPVYHFATKTLWVTKVQKYIDHGVTATLLAQNCVPNDFHIPFCPKKAPLQHLYTPVHHEPVHHTPVHHAPVHHEPQHQYEPVHHQPTQHISVHHEPVHHEPAHHETIHHKPVHETHYYNKITPHNAHEYPQPVHTENQHIAGHEVKYNGEANVPISEV